jgi:predicted O-methyltransferase YrrM
LSLDVLQFVENYSAELLSIGSEPPPAPRWTQDWFPRLDAAAAYALVRATRPRRILEVGSGHSTRFLARAARDQGLATRITAIDPQPRASLAGLPIAWLAHRVQDVSPEIFATLEPCDILFIDSSHQVRPGSDVQYLLDEALPRLAAGVRVHFHDIFLPDAYPAAWAWRRYNEQEAVARLLEDGFVAEFSSHQTFTRGTPGGVLARLPLPEGALESSLWLRKL